MMPATRKPPPRKPPARKKATPRRHIMNPGPIEVEVSARCAHECFVIAVSAPARWYIATAEPFDAGGAEEVVFHAHSDEDNEFGEPCDCWDKSGDE